jgi:hypothetical protein
MKKCLLSLIFILLIVVQSIWSINAQDFSAAQHRPVNLLPEIENPAINMAEPQYFDQSLQRGSTAYGYIHYPSSHMGYWKWDVDNISEKTLITSNFPDSQYGGAYFDDKIYTFQTLEEDENATDCTFYIFDSETGATINSVPRPELYGEIVSALSYDYTTQTMYAISSNALYTVDLTTGELTLVSSITGTSGLILTLAINLEGILYIVDAGTSSSLYIVDKMNGIAMEIGRTEVSEKVEYAQSMAFDHVTGTLYWCESETVYDNWMKIDITTGRATMIKARTYETTFLFFPYNGVIPEKCYPATALNVQYDDDCKAELSWTASTTAIAYNIYRDNQPIVNNHPQTTYTDSGFDIYEGHKWGVIAVCESDVSTIIEKSLDKCKEPEGINENVGTSFSIVPNPAKDKITISAENNFNTVEVINFLGQTVISQSNNGNTIEINVSNLTNGVYFVRIISDNGTTVQKFVKQ